MIPNVVIHLANEQPMLADLFDVPGADDVGMLCTNLRGLDGKKPIYIDQSDATFYFPYRGIRFLEIPPASMAGHRADGGRRTGGRRSDSTDEVEIAPIELPEPANLTDRAMVTTEDDADIELDEDFLQRIRDI